LPILTNRSFEFKPGKKVHDAIVGIRSGYNNEKHIAIEGDIKGAYDTVNRNILIKILGQRIKDRKFLNFIKKRFQYDYEETNEKTKPQDINRTSGFHKAVLIAQIY
jgi:retron-type reverse transcriptase